MKQQDYIKVSRQIFRKFGLNYISIILVVIIVGVSSYIATKKPTKAPQSSTQQTQPTKAAKLADGELIVDHVVDGDTIEVIKDKQKYKVRYIGVNTPETVKPNSPVECFGKEASNYNKRLMEGKTIRMESDVQDTDPFGRLLRYVYLKTDNAQEIFVNKKLVEDGYAYATAYPPNVKFQEVFEQAQKEAQEAHRGLWNSCRT